MIRKELDPKALAGRDREGLESSTLGRLANLLLALTAALYVAAPLIPSEAAVTHGAHVVLVVIGLVLVCGWLLAALLTGSNRVHFGWTGAALVAVAAWSWLSAWIMGPEGSVRSALNAAWLWTGFAAGFFLVRQLARSPAMGRAFCLVMIGLAVCLSVDGFYQYGYSMPQMRREYAQDPDEFLMRSGIDTRPGSPQRKLFEDRLGSTEPIATFALTNSLAGYLAPWLIVVLGIGLLAGGPQRGRQRAAAGAAAAIIAACLLLTKSRTGWIATAGGAALLVLFLQRSFAAAGPKRFGWKVPSLCAGVAVLLAAAAWAAGGLDRQVLSEAPKTLRYRLEYWRASAAMIADFPWWGCGPGNFQQYYTAYQLPQASETVADPHNFVLEMASTAGVPAAAALLLMGAALTFQIRRRPRRHEEPAGNRNSIPDSVGWVYGGALAGVALAFPIGLAIGLPQDFSGIALGALAAVACAAPLHAWVVQGRMPIWLPAIAAVVLFTNLLAAGALAYPGVSQTGWLLIALMVNMAERPGKARRLRPAAALVLLAVSGTLLTLCYRTEFQPVLHMPVLLGEGEILASRGQYERAAQAYRQAADVDPHSPEPWKRMADLTLQRWLQERSPRGFDQFETYAAEATRRNPRSSVLQIQLGDWRLRAFRAAGGREAIESATAAYQRAVELHPGSGFQRAQWAWALWLAGDRPEATRQATQALQLDSLMPHAEQKLAVRQVYDGQPPGAASRPLDTENAEQLMYALRAAN